MNTKQYATAMAKAAAETLNATSPDDKLSVADMAEIARWIQLGEVTKIAVADFEYWQHEMDGEQIVVFANRISAVCRAIGTPIIVTGHPQSEMLLVAGFADVDAAEKWLNEHEPVPVTRFDIDRILGIGDQFLADWQESDRETGEPKDAALSERETEWRVVRPLLVGSADLARLLADVVGVAYAAGCEHDQLREAVDLLETLREHRALPPTRKDVAVKLTMDHWKTVFATSIQAGEIWRPYIVISVDETNDGCRYRYKDKRDQGAKWSEEFRVLDDLVVDVFADHELDVLRLSSPEVGLDPSVALAVREYLNAIGVNPPAEAGRSNVTTKQAAIQHE